MSAKWHWNHAHSHIFLKNDFLGRMDTFSFDLWEKNTTTTLAKLNHITVVRLETKIWFEVIWFKKISVLRDVEINLSINFEENKLETQPPTQHRMPGLNRTGKKQLIKSKKGPRGSSEKESASLKHEAMTLPGAAGAAGAVAGAADGGSTLTVGATGWGRARELGDCGHSRERQDEGFRTPVTFKFSLLQIR